MDKIYISANELLEDSWRLGLQVLESGYRPSFVAGIWRGGSPVAIALHELLAFCGVEAAHAAIKTALYAGIAQTRDRVEVHGLDYLLERLTAADRLLIVDDVHDSGRSIGQVLDELETAFGDNAPEIRVATVWHKPGNNQRGVAPDYFLHQTGHWLVFPHELCGLGIDELLAAKPGMLPLAARLRELAGRVSPDERDSRL
jgi:uncharacterized protein